MFVGLYLHVLQETEVCVCVCVCDSVSYFSVRSLQLIGFVYGVQHHFQQYFSYIVVVSFVDGGNRSTHRKPPNTSNERGSNSQIWW